VPFPCPYVEWDERVSTRCYCVLRLATTRLTGVPPVDDQGKRPGQAVWAGKDSNLRRRQPADLQSAPFVRSGTDPQK